MQQARKDLFDLNGKVIVITGGASGLGLGYARGIAKYRGSLLIWDISEHKLKNAKAELESYGVKVTTHLVDVRSEEDIIIAYQQVIEQHGRLDCVFANAGIAPRSRSLLGMSSKEYLDLLAVSMHGAFYTLKEAARHMVERANSEDPGGSLTGHR